MALIRKKITVRGKSGKTFQRSVMVRAGEAVKRTAGKVAKFVGKHKGRLAAGAAVIGAGAVAAHYGIKHANQIHGAAKGLHSAISGHMAERREAKASGRTMAKGGLMSSIRSQVASGREAGRAADTHHAETIALGKKVGKLRQGIRDMITRDRVRGAASNLVTRAVSGVAGLHAAVSNRRARKAKAS